MKFTVASHKVAEDELAAIWLAASDRAAVTKAAHELDQELAHDVDRKASFVVLDIYELVIPPLRAYSAFLWMADW